MSAPVKLWRIVTVLSVLLSALALVGAAFSYYDSRHEAERISEAQLASCELVGDPITTAVKGLIEDQIEASKRVSADLFPDIPKKTFEELTTLQQIERRRRLAQLQAIPTCAERFTP